jgi:hypothetical protein
MIFKSLPEALRKAFPVQAVAVEKWLAFFYLKAEIS